MKKITFILAFLAVFSFQGCQTFINTVINEITNEVFAGHKLKIRAKGERIVSDYNRYIVDSGFTYAYVEFFGTTDADKTDYWPLVIIEGDFGNVLDSFSGPKAINGYHKEKYRIDFIQYQYIDEDPTIKIYAQLRSQVPTQDTAILMLTGIYVY